MTLEESDSHATAIFRLASIASIFVLIASGFLFCMIAEDVERFGHVYGEMVSELQTIRTESTDLVDYKLREKRQSFFRNNQYRTGFGGRHKTSFRNGDAPKICDCMVVQCPRGARGPPGQDGELAEDGAPGVAGKPGLDGVYLVEEIQCPPCPRGPRGPDGDAGEKGEAGKPGVGGIPGHDGTNEPGPMGEPGSRGQSGRSGKRGPPGEIGQDAVQLIGVPGVKGPDGPIGFQGPRGDPGENGNPAPPGPEGLSGTTGEPGDEGEYGPRGPPGRKGSQGIDGGYCQCPPREGAGIATSAGTESMPLTWEEYRRGSIRTVAIPESSRPFSRKLPAIPRLPQLPELPSLPQTGDEDEDTYPRSPAYNFQHRGYIDVPQAKISHSPMTPLIDYRDSREGVNNRVVMSRKRPSPVVRGSSVDFDLRRRL